MGRKDFSLRLDFRLALALLIYVILGLSLIKCYRYQINPDGISYISIAQTYLKGDFSHIVNGYWGPVLSWLLIPFLYFDLEPLLAMKLLALLTGLMTIIALRALSYKFEMPASARTVILFSAIPAVLFLAFSVITPDLLLACILLFYHVVIFSDDYAGRTSKGVVCGVLGGVAYLSKSFAFPFFVSHFLIMNVLHYFRSETKEVKKKVLTNFLIGFTVFAVISGVWIGLISHKYEKLIFGCSGQATLRGDAAPNGQGPAVLWQGFLEPPYETAVSAWDDPCYLEMPPYNPLGSWFNFVHQLKVIGGNIQKTAGFFMEFSVLSLIIAIAYVLLWLRGFSIRKMPREVLYPMVTIALIVGGYCMVLVEARYIWILFVLMMLMGGYVLGRLFRNSFFTKTRRAALLVIFFLAVTVPAAQDLREYTNRGKWIHNLSLALKDGIKPDSKIVSNTSWPGSLYLAYHLDCRYYGAEKKNITRAELKRDLEKYGIDYYLVWGGVPIDYSFLTNYREITSGRIPGLKIYGLKNRR